MAPLGTGTGPAAGQPNRFSVRYGLVPVPLARPPEAAARKGWTEDLGNAGDTATRGVNLCELRRRRK